MTKHTATSRKPLLAEVRVLDLTQYLAGPFCTRLLNDMGAEVIKIEAPPFGDGARYAPYMRAGYSGYFIQNNCGKKSVCLNLKTDAGKELFLKLVEWADVCVENFAPGVMHKLGLDYETLALINPRLIMCSISGFGQYGPWSRRPGFAATAHAISGLMWIAGKEHDRSAPPTAPGAAFGDTGASLHAFGAICAALYRREKDGQGEYIDIALLDALFDQIDSAIEIYIMSQGQDDSALLSSVLMGSNGYATIAFGTSDAEWRKLTQVMGRPDLVTDERFASIKARVQHLDSLYALIEKWLQGFANIDDALRLLEEDGITCARILSVPEAIAHPQIKAREMMVEIDHPVLGRLPVVNSPFRMRNTRAGLTGLPPELGEHNAEVLRRLGGLTSAQIQTLEAKGVLYRKEN